jgi:hypothetical protein
LNLFSVLSCIVEHELVCDECGESSEVRELFRHLSLNIPDQKTGKARIPPNLQELLELYFKVSQSWSEHLLAEEHGYRGLWTLLCFSIYTCVGVGFCIPGNLDETVSMKAD